jgi:hypothetical protein
MAMGGAEALILAHSQVPRFPVAYLHVRAMDGGWALGDWALGVQIPVAG